MGCGQKAAFDFSRAPCRTNLSYGETQVLLAGVCGVRIASGPGVHARWASWRAPTWLHHMFYRHVAPNHGL